MTENGERLRDEVKREVNGLKRQEKEKGSWLGQTAHLGTLGVLFILPVVGGAYLGNWLDGRLKGFSFSWTVSLIVLGVFVGAFNVYHFIRERQ
jgi:ATP synthase protein I